MVDWQEGLVLHSEVASFWQHALSCVHLVGRAACFRCGGRGLDMESTQCVPLQAAAPVHAPLNDMRRLKPAPGLPGSRSRARQTRQPREHPVKGTGRRAVWQGPASGHASGGHGGLAGWRAGGLAGCRADGLAGWRAGALARGRSRPGTSGARRAGHSHPEARAEVLSSSPPWREPAACRPEPFPRLTWAAGFQHCVVSCLSLLQSSAWLFAHLPS